mgnify:CR=1 FL=1
MDPHDPLAGLPLGAADPADAAALADLAAMVMTQIELQHAFGRIDPISGLPNRSQFIEDLVDLANERAPGEARKAYGSACQSGLDSACTRLKALEG